MARSDVSATHGNPCADEAVLFPFQPPEPGGAPVEVAEGVLWFRMPMPMKLDHVNVYAIKDHDGWCVIDTGLNTEQGRQLWQQAVDQYLEGLPLKSLICTHFHYDHAGLSAWMMEQYKIPLYMTYGEYFTMRAYAIPVPEPLPSSLVDFYRRAGLSDERRDQIFTAFRNDPFMAPPPRAFRRLREGQVLEIGDRQWRVLIGEGHSPEHACLYCQSDGLLIAGDQLLPRITSNVLVSEVEPESNPLKLWLDSLDRLASLKPETLVLPAHELVFTGLHSRVAALHAHHDEQCQVLRECLREHGAATANQAKAVLFPRKLGVAEDMMALGETIAHLSLLRYRGEVERVLDDNGCYCFRLARAS